MTEQSTSMFMLIRRHTDCIQLEWASFTSPNGVCCEIQRLELWKKDKDERESRRLKPTAQDNRSTVPTRSGIE